MLPEADKAGASRTFFTKVKEELDYIPAQMVVLEYWQEKAVFAASEDAECERMISAPPPNTPAGQMSRQYQPVNPDYYQQIR